jgi:ribosome maturation factor RimP
MSAPSQADGVRALAQPLAEQAGLVVESVTVTPAGKRRVLRVVVDLPPERAGGVPMDQVAKAAQAISGALDSSSVMGGTPYVLEVSSPGTDRPLTERRHWMRARGRLVNLVPAPGTNPPWAGQQPAGRLTAVDDEGLELDAERRVGWAEVVSGRIEVEFGRIDDSDGDDSDDEGDEEEDLDDPLDDGLDGGDDDLDDDEGDEDEDTDQLSERRG